MTENSTPEVIESITPSPVAKMIIVGVAGVALGVFLGYAVAKILTEERPGHYTKPVKEAVEVMKQALEDDDHSESDFADVGLAEVPADTEAEYTGDTEL
jgi:hypothetical protein